MEMLPCNMQLHACTSMLISYNSSIDRSLVVVWFAGRCHFGSLYLCHRRWSIYFGTILAAVPVTVSLMPLPNLFVNCSSIVYIRYDMILTPISLSFNSFFCSRLYHIVNDAYYSQILIIPKNKLNAARIFHHCSYFDLFTLFVFARCCFVR